MKDLLKYLPMVLEGFNLLRALMQLIDSLKAGQNPNVAPFAKKVWTYIPHQFKHPAGPATEEEFVNAMYELFLLFTK